MHHQLKEVYELLSNNYVEDNEASFRFEYTADFFEWCVRWLFRWLFRGNGHLTTLPHQGSKTSRLPS